MLSDKPLGPAGAVDNLEPALLDELLGHIGSLAAVYHKPPSAFGLVAKKTTVRTGKPPHAALFGWFGSDWNWEGTHTTVGAGRRVDGRHRNIGRLGPQRPHRLQHRRCCCARGCRVRAVHREGANGQSPVSTASN